MNNTKKIIIAASIAVFIILAILFISFALPFFTASKILKSKITDLERIKESETLQLSDPYNSDGSLIPTTVDVFLDGEKADTIAAELISIMQNTKYSGKETSTHGFWDISISLRFDGKISTLYLCKDEIYVTDGASKYSFKPTKATEYSLFYKKISNMIYEEANSTHNS